MAAKAATRKSKKTEAEAAGKKKKAVTKKAVPKKAAKKEAPKKAAVKKAPRKRKSAKNARIKAFWGVFNQNLKRVALFEFNERKKAETRARELSASGKSPHFIQPVKEPVVE
jgi:hypothetical protein